ncbi:adenosine-specific kinase [candidate division CSSED10-310 bacterium]|uniref:Adenosine-specific kinase n=1 Tax=candidate division CSSED10-310 bacterium TaxID=2855610 RepID=A0ABV6Z3U8_UNCC1
MQTSVVMLDFPADANIILGMTHFIKSVEDLYEIMVNAAPQAQFGLAFCEASQDRLVRVEGNDQELKQLAAKNALNIGAGHSFLIIMKNCFPINVLNDIKMCREVCRIFCATANPVNVLIAETDLGRGIIGVVDGSTPVGIEDEAAITARKEFLRTIGYKR